MGKAITNPELSNVYMNKYGGYAACMWLTELL